MIRDRSRAAGSFTLVEMLVASALLALVGFLLAGAIQGTAAVSLQATSRMESTRTARESLDLLGRELAMVVVPWQRANTNYSPQFCLNPANVPAMDANPDSIFWQAPMAHTTTYGNLAIVGYFVLRDIQPKPANSRFQLRRIFVDPTASTAVGDYGIYSTNSWIIPALFSDFGAATGALDNQNNQKGWLADGVLGLWVRCLDKAGNPILLNAAGGSLAPANVSPQYDSRAGYKSSVANSYLCPAGYNALPAFVEAAIICISPREIPRLTTLAAAPATNPTNFYATIDAYAQTIRRQNPSLSSVQTYIRRFRVYGSDY